MRKFWPAAIIMFWVGPLAAQTPVLPDSAPLPDLTALVTPAMPAADSVPPDMAGRLTPEALAECMGSPQIPLTIHPVFPEPVYDFGTSLQEVQQLATDSEHSIRESLTMGLTRYNSVVAIDAPVQVLNFENGLSCLHVDHVTVTVGYEHVTVYVPFAIPRPSCGFDTVMGHEMKHVAVNRQLLADYAPLFGQRLLAYLQTNSVYRWQPAAPALARLQQDMHLIMQQTYDEMQAENNRRQRLVDSPQEYQRISQSCGGQLQDIGRSFQQNVHY